MAASVALTRLRSRGVLRMRGRDTVDFLHAMSTNDAKGAAADLPQYTAFLNSKGRVLFDAVAHPAPAAAEEPMRLLEMDRELVPLAIDHLREYKLRKKVKFEDASTELAVAVSSADTGDSAAASPATSIPADAFAVPWLPDPRAPVSSGLNLRRALVKADALAADENATGSEDAYREALYSIGVAEGKVAFTLDKSLPFDANLDFLDGVSFHKGCYVGQELTHRTHIMLVVRKRLVPLTLPADVAGAPDAASLVGQSIFIPGGGGTSAGRVLGWAGKHGVGLLRLPNLGQGNREGVFAVGRDDADAPRVRAHLPAWWPQDALKGVFGKE